MPTTLDWSDIDPMVGSSNGVVRNSPQHSMVQTTSFWSPSHPLFGFGVLVAATAGALYLVNEGAGVGIRARFGQLHASGEANLEGER